MSVLAWILKNYQSIGFVLLCVFIGGLYGWHMTTVEELEKSIQNWREQAQTAQAELASAREDKRRLEIALSEQEKAVADAQAKRTVIYRTVKEEIAKDENARDWYNAPVPAGISGLLKNSRAGHD